MKTNLLLKIPGFTTKRSELKVIYDFKPSVNLMLRSFLLFILVSSVCIVRAQAPLHSFTASTVTFTPLTANTTISSGLAMDDAVFQRTLPFNFNFNGVLLTSIYISENGYITLGTTNPGTAIKKAISASDTGFQVIAPLSMDLKGNNVNSKLSFKVTGTSPNRVYTIEWLDMQDNGGSLKISFQLLLRESSNSIEMLYGQATAIISGGTLNPEIGLRGRRNLFHNSRTMSISNPSWNNTRQSTNPFQSVNIFLNQITCNNVRFIWTPVPGTILPVTGSASSITSDSALVSGSSSGGSIGSTSSGIAYGLELYPDTLSNSIVSLGFVSGSTTGKLKNILSDTVYHYRFYTRILSGVFYGADSTFRTPKLPSIQNNSITSGNQVHCTSSTRDSIYASLPTGGNGNYSYIWQSSAFGPTSGFTAFPGNDKRNVFPQNITGNRWYRRIVASNSLRDTSSVVLVTINQVRNDSIYGPQEVCQGSTAKPLRAGTQTVIAISSYSWLRSTTDSINGYTVAPGTSNLVTYSPGIVTQTAWYKVVSIAGNCVDTSKFFALRPNSSPKSFVVRPSGVSSNFGAPSSIGAFQRGIAYYSASEIGDVINAGDSISRVGWSLKSYQGSTQAIGNLKVYLVNTTDTVFNRGSNTTPWSTMISTPTNMVLVYDSIYNYPITAGPFTVNLQNKFAYTGQAIYVAFEYSITNPGGGQTFDYNLNQMGSCMSGTSGTSLPNTLSAPSILRPLFLVGTNCSGSAPVVSLPGLNTSSATSITTNAAILGGHITNDGGASITERGVVYSTSLNPTTTSGTKVIMGSGTGIFSQNISGLSSGTTYHFRAYAINSAGTAYGADSIFTTVSLPGAITNNTISSAQTICSGSIPNTLTGSTPAGGNNTFSYTWLSSTSSAQSGFTAASGTNNTLNYSPSALNQNTWFRRYVVSGTSTDTSAAIMITVNQAIGNNTISSISESVCSGNIPDSITGTNPTGGNGISYNYQWLVSSTAFNSGYSLVNGQSSSFLIPSALTQNTWYKRIVSSGVCAADTSSAWLFVVNPAPGFSIGTIANINTTASSFLIPYSAITGSANQYSISTTSPNALPGFIAVNNATLGSSPITVNIPTSAAGTYHFNIRLKNSNTGCLSNLIPFSLTINGVAGPDAPPIITNIIPRQAKPGDTILIEGSGFNTTPLLNTVFFAGVKATVLNASSNQLQVIVPIGSVHTQVVVTNSGKGLSARSMMYFKPVYAPVKNTIQTCDFEPRVEFGVRSTPREIASGDLDSDGKLDLVVLSLSPARISIYRNVAVSGKIDTNSFQARVDRVVANFPHSVKIEDIDRDGKPDIIVSSYLGNKISIFKNQHLSGSIDSASFSLPVEMTITAAKHLLVSDFDADGKQDIVTVSQTNKISVLKNIGNAGEVNSGSYAPKTDFHAGKNVNGIIAADFDGDNKPDIIAMNYDSAVISVLRNLSSNDTIRFSAPNYINSPNGGMAITAGDFDDDGKIDFAAGFISGAIKIYKNEYVSGSLDSNSFRLVATKITSSKINLEAADISGDGNLDIIGANSSSQCFGVVHNKAINKVLDSAAFATVYNFPTGSPIGFHAIAADIDADGKPDLIATHDGASKFSIMRNTEPSGIISIQGSLSGFKSCQGTVSDTQSVRIIASNLISGLTIIAPNGFEVMHSNNNWSNQISIAHDNGGINAVLNVRIKNNATGNLSGDLRFSSTCANTVNLQISGAVNPVPVISLGTIPDVNISSVSFSIPYTSTSGNPDVFSLNTGSPNVMPGFNPISNAAITSSPLVIPIPTSAVNTYHFNLLVKNSSTTCTSTTIPISLKVENSGIVNNAIFGNQQICSGESADTLFGSIASGGISTIQYSWISSTKDSISAFNQTTGQNFLVNYVPGTLSQSTWYRRIARDGSNADTSNAVYVEVKVSPAKPVIAIQAVSPVCAGAQYLNFGAASEAPIGVNYQWSVSNAELYAQGNTKQYSLVSFPEAGNAKVYLTASQNGCSSVAEVSVDVLAGPVHTATVRYFNKNFVCEANLVNKYQWGFDDKPSLKGNIIEGEINQNYYNLSPDLSTKSYWVISSKGSCYQKTYYNMPSAIWDATSDIKGFDIYPNPFENQISVKADRSFVGAELIITDLNGKQLRSIQITEEMMKLNLEELPAGMYFIKMQNGQSFSSTVKIVKY